MNEKNDVAVDLAVYEESRIAELMHELKKKEDKIKKLRRKIRRDKHEKKFNRLFWFTCGFGLFAFTDSFIRHAIDLYQHTGL